MRYEEFYNEQVIKYKKRRVFLTKRLPFIIIGALILLSIILVLFFTSGTPYEYGLSNIEYGDTLSLEAKSFLASSSYEFLVDGEYVDTPPTKPGKYSYRVKSTNIFGVTKYSSDFEFEISKAKAYISVGDTEINYGEEPKKIVSNLPYDKKISSYNIAYSNYHQVKTEAWVTDAVILDSEGADVTDYYDLEFPKTEITINKAPLVIKLKDKEKEYDGSPLTYSDSSDYTVEGLLQDDLTIEVTTRGSQTLVGEAEYEVTGVVLKDQNGNIYETYDYQFEPGTLTVYEKEIEFRTEDTTKTYNGESQEFNSYTLSEEIPDTCTVLPLVLNEAGVYEYKLTPTFVNQDGVDVSACYNVSYSFGEVEIAKASVTVAIDDLSIKYNGKTSFAATYTISSGSLFDSELEITVESTIREVGSGEVSMKSYKLMKDGKSVSDCFELEFLDAEIEITPKDLVITPKDATKEYDGLDFETTEFIATGLVNSDVLTVTSKSTDTEIGEGEITVDTISIMHSGADVSSCYSIEYQKGTLTITKKVITVTIDDQEITYGDTPVFTYSASGLLAGDSFEITDYNYSMNIGNNMISASDFTVTDGVNNRIDLYDINIVPGNLIVNKKALAISMYSKNKIYDGTYLELTPLDYYISGGSLIDGDNITFYPSNDKITNVGTKVVTISNDNLSIMNASNEFVTECYDIEFNSGTLTIIPRTVVITTGSITKKFDYDVLTCDDILVSGLVDGNVIEVEITGKLFYVGTTKNTVGSIKVYSSSAEDRVDITLNYTFNVYEGTLTYTERGAQE